MEVVEADFQECNICSVEKGLDSDNVDHELWSASALFSILQNISDQYHCLEMKLSRSATYPASGKNGQFYKMCSQYEPFNFQFHRTLTIQALRNIVVLGGSLWWRWL